jgi:hypothetical protein
MCRDNWGRSSYARALIEISAKHDFIESISLAIPELEGNNFIVENVKVEYEWKPPRCERCCVFGHESSVCPKMPVQVIKVATNVVDEEGFT